MWSYNMYLHTCVTSYHMWCTTVYKFLHGVYIVSLSCHGLIWMSEKLPKLERM